MSESISEFLTKYSAHVKERAAKGLPPKPLNAGQTKAVIEGLKYKAHSHHALLADLLLNRVSPGVSEAAKVKSAFLAGIVSEKFHVDSISRVEAVLHLGHMKGGASTEPLIAALSNTNEEIAFAAAVALKDITMIYDRDFDHISTLCQEGNRYANDVLRSWAKAEWFEKAAQVPDELIRVVFRVEGETNTNDLSPATAAATRDDIPKHAQSFLAPKALQLGIENPGAHLKQLQKQTGYPVVLVNAGPLGTESSRKSAWNSLAYLTGFDVCGVPNKRSGAVFISDIIAPIFEETAQDSGGLPIAMDTAHLEMGEIVHIRPKEGIVLNARGAELARFKLDPSALAFYRAGGALAFYIGRKLTEKAAAMLSEAVPDFLYPDAKTGGTSRPMTLAQKIIAKAAGVNNVMPGQICFPKVGLVASQDTTGPMTLAELDELACSHFSKDVFCFQSTCHTSDEKFYTPEVQSAQKYLTEAFIERGGVGLKYGDGIIHSYSNYFNLPQEISISGDSHGRASPGLGFPAGSGRVAYAATTGSFALKVPESVLVRFKGDITAAKKRGITVRDLVHAVPYFARQEGLMRFGNDPEGALDKQRLTYNAFSGCIIEFEGLEHLSLPEIFQHTCATAERMAVAGVANLGLDQTIEHMNNSLAHIEKMIGEGYKSREALEKRRNMISKWLEAPELLRADPGAKYLHILEIDIDKIREPLIAIPNTPHWIDRLSVHAGRPIDYTAIVSCMTIAQNFTMARKIMEIAKSIPLNNNDTSEVIGIMAPSMRSQVEEMPDVFTSITKAGIEVANAGCNICMGNQRRIPSAPIHTPDGTERTPVIMGSIPRNSAGRTGDTVQQYAASAELTALVSIDGKIPTPERYAYIMKTANETGNTL